MQIAADVGDLVAALEPKKSVFDQTATANDRCTSFVKLTPGNEDLFVSQNTFSSYGTMLRTLKKYSLGYHLTPGESPLWSAIYLSQMIL